MSLINDALKRASQSQKPGAAPAAGPHMQPVSVKPAPPLNLALIATLVLTLMVLGVSAFFFMRASRRDHSMAQAALPMTPSLTNPAPTPAPAATRAPDPPKAAPPAVAARLAAKPATPRVATNVTPAKTTAAPRPTGPTPPARSTAVPPVPASVVTTTPTAKLPSTSAPPPAAAATVKPEFPALKLQGIYLRRTNSSALINGHDVYVGDEVQGAVVKAIEQRRVLLEFRGETRALTLR